MDRAGSPIYNRRVVLTEAGRSWRKVTHRRQLFCAFPRARETRRKTTVRGARHISPNISLGWSVTDPPRRGLQNRGCQA
jgi:hypothetical protein